NGKQAIYGGMANDSATWPEAGASAGKLVVFTLPAGADFRSAGPSLNATRRTSRFAGSLGLAVVLLENVASDLVDQFMQGRVSTDTAAFTGRPVTMFVTRQAASALIGGDVATARAGH